MATCLIGLGANLGNRRQTLEAAVCALQRHEAGSVVAQSAWHETPPAGGPVDQPSYLNGAIVLKTSLSPESLLAVLFEIEKELGRRRDERWGPRTIDLDLLLYDQCVLDSPELTLPHPRMAWRRFVLVPAVEAAGAMVHPTTGWTLDRLLRHLDTTPDYVALAGGIGVGKTSLAEALVQRRNGRLIAEKLDADELTSFYADPSGRAWRMELEWLHQRVELLAADHSAWAEPRLAVSDFWFGQSRAFARVWLPPERVDAFEQAWQEASRRVVRPKLTVLVEAPPDELARRVDRRGRPFEQGLDAIRLGQIQDAIRAATREPDVGPVLRLSDGPTETMLAELDAAVEAMRPYS
ncbi:MAG: 2-amino-4-hydroxy-6-hydroxymethyldihydropteridine diphosphokinase [Pirellulales bacterium]|nr:2-amino-4-hydroxy-6-hydroxymethyldihydropteridine diphosphokinase [Pirellulales bacterium]